MVKTVDAQLTQLRFPSMCVVCMSPASKQYKIEQIFTYGRRSYTVSVDVPMCRQHFEVASFKGSAEKFIGYLAIPGGVLAGIFAVIMLLLRWEGQNGLITKLFVGGMVGFGFFILAWWIISALITPLFAVRETKEARTAVRITYYSPKDQFIRLSFRNEQLAEIVQRENLILK